ncbi:MAG: aminotransferase class I/II-fold pyridoxal phosphate-dependent enzyme [Syntrophomonadaceae bacterium]|nr:aminotransferase class I/II-fold pyridoxal phosphate-dependent enzyme [Syntrophomonadaceae bacterium]
MSKGNKYLSKTVLDLAPSGIRRFFDVASQMEDVISLGVGEPDFVTPWHIREACFDSLERGYTMYSSNQGIIELREEITKYMYRTQGLKYDPEKEVLITVGVSEATDLILRALLMSGEEVLIPEPAYVSYVPCTVMAGGKPVILCTDAEHEFRLTAAELASKVTDKSKALILSYPNNPTGAIMEREDLEALVDIIIKNDLIVISDEIYGELTYGGQKHVSIATLPGMKERTIVLNGFSKAYAMTGWRIGYACGDPDIIGAMNKIHQYTMLCAPMMGQKAALEALRHGEGEMHRMVEDYDRRRHLFLKGFQEIGLPCFEPKGAFYVFPSIARTGLGSVEFCERLLHEEKVAVVPGNAFGSCGEGFIRCCYAYSVEHIQQALEKINRFIVENEKTIP